MLLENVGADQAVRLGNPQVWRDAIDALESAGRIRVDVSVENPSRRGAREYVPSVVVRTDVMMSTLPAAALESVGITRYKLVDFQRANGAVFQRWAGAVIVTVEGRSTIDDVIFAEPGDTIAIGWRVLSGLNLRFDPSLRRLVDAGPVPAAAAA